MIERNRINRLTGPGEKFFPKEWSEIIPSLPPGYQELPESCRVYVDRLIATTSQLVDEFPRYPITSSCLAEVSHRLEREASLFARELTSWGHRRKYVGSSPNEIWRKAHKSILQEETKETERKKLAVALCGLVSQVTKKKLTDDQLSPPLLAHCIEATKSFADRSFTWAMFSDQPGFGNNFPFLSLPFYNLGASGLDVGSYQGQEVLIANFLYTERGKVVPKLLIGPLK